MRHHRFILLSLLPLTSFASSAPDFKATFESRNACFIISDLSTGKVVQAYNQKLCAERLSPCSTFKVAAALMAFEKGILKDDHQIVKWDGTHYDRKELNQDQSPYDWMSNSVMWVTQWITPQLTLPTIQKFLKDFNYGNQDFSGGITQAWVDSTLKISAKEELRFISDLWQEKLPVSKRTIELTKKIIYIGKVGNTSDLFGKTGTGCMDAGCMKHVGRMLGRFYGVVTTGQKTYAIAATSIDTVPEKIPAGPRLRKTLEKIMLDTEVAK